MNGREKDDEQTGRILTRRELVALLGGAGAGILVADARAGFPQCVGKPEQTEGPYYLDLKLNRSDIRSDPSDGSAAEGIPLSLEFRVSRIANQGCTPLAGAEVDVWHCDARGIYSGVRDPRFNTTGKKFLRGYQVTDRAGTARFTTIYPGWYPGRTVHIHFKIRENTSSGRRSEFTSQLYFDDSVTDQVCAAEPYVRSGRRMMRNADDFLFRNGGTQLLLAPVKTSEGYSAVFEISLV
jgi:protocatechuate 3,4-dioxygenase beta subunit